MNVEARILDRIRPTAAEDAKLAAVTRELIEKLEATLRARGWDGQPILVGSIAKGTHLTGTEIDLFVAFPPDLPRKDLEARGLELGRLAERGVHMYAEHPYTRGWYGGFEVEIVPCYRIVDPSQRMSAVDRTPLHADYVLGHLAEGQADEVRLLKAWTEGIGVYGAEAKVRGFSGYLCELLVLKHGSFRKVLEASQGWRPGHVIELGRAAGKAFDDPLVVVDPVDPNRNVASAVSLEQLATFVHGAREYLRGPSERFFFPRPRKPLTVARLQRLIRRRGSEAVAVAIPAPRLTDDVLYPQLRKAHHALEDLFRRHGFVVHDSRFDLVRGEAVFLFEFAHTELPQAMRHEGPPVWVRNAHDFLTKWSRNRRTLSGPYLSGDRWFVDVEREHTRAADFLRAKKSELSLGRDLDRAARRSIKVLVARRALATRYASAWTQLFDKRFPWER